LVPDQAQLEKIEKKLKSLNPSATIQRTQKSKINPKDFLNIQAFELERVLDFDAGFLDEDGEHEHDSRVSSIAVKVEADMNMNLLEAWISRVIGEDGASLYRYKGVISVKGFDSKFVFQGVGMLFTGGFSDTKWKPDEKRESRFVFIGKNLDESFYREGFISCRQDGSLRFSVGTLVEANCGTWKKGKIIRQWDEGNAYRVELEDANRTNVWAPIDIDAYVRARKS